MLWSINILQFFSICSLFIFKKYNIEILKYKMCLIVIKKNVTMQKEFESCFLLSSEVLVKHDPDMFLTAFLIFTFICVSYVAYHVPAWCHLQFKHSVYLYIISHDRLLSCSHLLSAEWIHVNTCLLVAYYYIFKLDCENMKTSVYTRF